MNEQHRYQLESPRLTGHRQQKTTCPQCGRKKCFVRYIDIFNSCRYINDAVGRCDHEQSCAYHYKPKEFLRDHPWNAENQQRIQLQQLPPPPPPPLQPLPMQLVSKSHSTKSTFWHWFTTECAQRLNLAPTLLRSIYDDYYIGATREGDIIFWQIDDYQRVRSGHIMRYNPHGDRQGLQSWTHTRMIRNGLLPTNWKAYQCLFGEHLLSRHPKAHVCIVEGEKTALVMAARKPQYLWLATAGCSGLSPNKIECLRSRRFTLFPDSGCLKKWQSVMEQTKGLSYNFSERLESYPPNTDMVDLLLNNVQPVQ